GRAIDSVLAQTYSNWELLVIDDGSTDGTRAVVERYERDPRVRYLRQDHQGVSAARNLGLAESRGEIIAHLDSDNVWYPRYLEAVTQALARHPERDSVYLAQLVRDHGEGTAYIRSEPFDRPRLLDGNYIDLNVFSHRRTLVDRHGGF